LNIRYSFLILPANCYLIITYYAPLTEEEPFVGAFHSTPMSLIWDVIKTATSAARSTKAVFVPLQ